ncbi:MAG: hypothetical protein ABSH50_33210 [Bryobacteraceae bacterium]|jgi:hypothetical protein
MLVTIKAINRLAERGHTARRENAGQYFCFQGGEATDWLDRTVQVSKVSSLALEQWIEEFDRLKKRNAEIFRAAKGKSAVKGKRRLRGKPRFRSLLREHCSARGERRRAVPRRRDLTGDREGRSANWPFRRKVGRC